MDMDNQHTYEAKRNTTTSIDDGTYDPNTRAITTVSTHGMGFEYPPPPPPPPGSQGTQLPPLEYQPYIGRNAKLSRAWATHTVVLLLMTAVIFIFNAQSAHELGDRAIANLNTGCMSVQSATDTVVNLPRTMAVATVRNAEETSRGVVRMTGRMLTGTLSAISDLIIFVIKLYAGTAICIAEVLIKAGLSVAEDAAKEVIKVANTTINGLLKGVKGVSTIAADGIDTVVNGVGSLISKVTGEDNKEIDLSSALSKLDMSIDIPSDWTNKISDLANKIPTEDEIFGNITSIIDKPLASLRSLITDTFNGANIDFADKVHYPEPKRVDMCDGNLGRHSIGALSSAVAKLMYIAAGLLIAVAVGMTLWNAYMIDYQNRRFQTRVVWFREGLDKITTFKDTHRPAAIPVTNEELDLFMLPSRPLLHRVKVFVEKKFGGSQRMNLWRWYADYIYHPPSLACLVAGFLGLVCIWVQISAINGMRQTYVPKLANELDEFQNDFLGGKILGKVQNDSVAMSNNINLGISDVEGGLNKTLFEPVNEGTAGLNSTLNEVVETYIGFIRKIFGGTPFQTPVEGLINCTITKKIQSVQKILSFVNEHVGGVNLPRVSDDVLTNPVRGMLRPVNASANALKKLAVGIHIPNAKSLDAKKFPTKEELNHSKALASVSSHSTDENQVSTVSSAADLHRRDDAETTSSSTYSSSTDDSSSVSVVASSSAESASQSSSELGSELGGLDTESEHSHMGDEDSDDEESSASKTELTREEVEDAQKYKDYTGGLIGELCDSYVKHLKKQIPLMVALMMAWLLLAAGGLVRVGINLRKLSKRNY
ncbi:plasma membrane fusion protein prm1 [Linderina pennispora]|nr:plasma membrane fusion protein prm1 [Linderina pennispora]